MPFTNFEATSHTLHFNPSNANVLAKPYQISIVLEDRNPYPKGSKYIISVNVFPSNETFITNQNDQDFVSMKILKVF